MSSDDMAFRDAAKSGDITSMNQILKRGINVNACTKYGLTALHNAASADQAEAVELILQKGGTLSLNMATKSGELPIHLACKGNFVSVAEKLVKAGSDLNVRNTDGLAPLHIAVSQSSVPIVKLLLDHGADLDVVTNEGQTPLALCTDQAVRSVLDGAPKKKVAPVAAPAAEKEKPKELAVTPPPSEINSKAEPKKPSIESRPATGVSAATEASHRQNFATPTSGGDSNQMMRLIQTLQDEVRDLKDQVVALQNGTVIPSTIQVKIGGRVVTYRYDGF
eukprot:TRINITY_DN1837_c0_g1_i2.p1 TRINITY_DN1837_c0_g1~~TRINITY_DN1837_c0_g1_i2.p1  ORF type:complete len:289 (-),score=59.52 TRINITY_DN1837_c0_g1_i2:803-1636(-)